VRRVEITSAEVDGRDVPRRLVGFATEEWRGARRLWVQVDLPGSAPGQRSARTRVELVAR
jgi:hypothetical protein